MAYIHKVTLPKGAKPANQGGIKGKQNRHIYDSARHRRERAAYLRENPFCKACAEKGKQKIATVFDHIKPINAGGDPWDLSNKQGLCDSCHNSKRQKERAKIL